MWKKCEIENYLCNHDAIISYITDKYHSNNSSHDDIKKLIEEKINGLKEAYKTIGKPEPFSDDIKASDDFLTPLFENFAKDYWRNEVFPENQVLRKTYFYKLVQYIPLEEIDDEVRQVLDQIADVAKQAIP